MQNIVDFILELDKLKAVTRKTRPIGLDRYENPAEHSWQIAMFAVSLAPYAAAAVDIDHVVHMLLVHDIGEIDTGDTFVFQSLADCRHALDGQLIGVEVDICVSVHLQVDIAVGRVHNLKTQSRFVAGVHDPGG